MLLEDFLKRCVLLKSLTNNMFYSGKVDHCYPPGTLFLGTHYQQVQNKHPIYEILPNGHIGWRATGWQIRTKEYIKAFPYDRFLKSRRGIHTNKNPFARFELYTLDRFYVLYPDYINTTVGVSDFTKDYPIRIVSKTELRDVILENKDGKATFKAFA